MKSNKQNGFFKTKNRELTGFEKTLEKSSLEWRQFYSEFSELKVILMKSITDWEDSNKENVRFPNSGMRFVKKHCFQVNNFVAKRKKKNLLIWLTVDWKFLSIRFMCVYVYICQ